MRYRHKYSLLLASGVLFALPAASQDAPESLLPPGFGDPEPKPAASPPPQNTQPAAPNQTQPSQSAPSQSEQSQSEQSQSASSPVEAPRPDGRASVNENRPSSAASIEDDVDEEDAPISYVVPAAKRRSLGVVGVINQRQGGFAQSTFSDRDGEYLTRLIKSIKAPFLSRWASIMTRRLLMSKTAAPDNVDGADWVAERAWLLLRMGESVNARHLVQQVDADQYSDRLYGVSMPVFLSNGDLAGFCPMADAAARKTDAPSWKMSRVVCLSLSGEQSRATSLLNRARRGQWATGVDYLLAEKAIGAGTNGRRAVKIEWEGVNGFNAWRHGLAIATGVKPPEKFYNISGRHVRSWLTLAPMVPINDRIFSSYAAAANGALSNQAMVDLFASAEEDPDASPATLEKAEFLNNAYTGDVANRISAMRSLWESRESEIAQYSMKILTARAAARIMPADMDASDIDAIVASMMTAGLDTQALRWIDYAGAGTKAWAQIAVGSNIETPVGASAIDDFYDLDQSENQIKTGFLIAALDGLGRLEGDYNEIADQYGVNTRKDSRWSQSLNKAVARNDKGAVVLLVAAGLQGNVWNGMPAFHIYHSVKALNAIGLNAEARMIAAEAIDRV